MCRGPKVVESACDINIPSVFHAVKSVICQSVRVVLAGDRGSACVKEQQNNKYVVDRPQEW